MDGVALLSLALALVSTFSCTGGWFRAFSRLCTAWTLTPTTLALIGVLLFDMLLYCISIVLCFQMQKNGGMVCGDGGEIAQNATTRAQKSHVTRSKKQKTSLRPSDLKEHRHSANINAPTTNETTMKTSLLLLASLATTTSAFGSFGKPKTATPKLPLPTFDDATQRYVKSPDDDGVMPYDAIGAALRHGPVPFITRLTNADEYEQGVLKYMGTAKVSRAEAVGNMDAKLNNPMDW